MNTTHTRLLKGVVMPIAVLAIAACTTVPTPRVDPAAPARARLIELQSDAKLSTRAPVAIMEAESAVRAAEAPQEDAGLEKHLVFVAEHKVDIAWARAERRFYEDQHVALRRERDQTRLDARTAEVKFANDAADTARSDQESTQREADELRAQIAELSAEETARGLLVTLGDVLFVTGGSELNRSAEADLDKLSTFLGQYENRTVMIEGHTDNVGSEDSNYGLSRRRADAVKAYLVQHGVAASRLTTVGKGEGSPITGNDSAFGRQQNRRVEVIIANAATSQR